MRSCCCCLKTGRLAGPLPGRICQCSTAVSDRVFPLPRGSALSARAGGCCGSWSNPRQQCWCTDRRMPRHASTATGTQSASIRRRIAHLSGRKRNEQGKQAGYDRREKLRRTVRRQLQTMISAAHILVTLIERKCDASVLTWTNNDSKNNGLAWTSQPMQAINVQETEVPSHGRALHRSYHSSVIKPKK